MTLATFVIVTGMETSDVTMTIVVTLMSGVIVMSIVILTKVVTLTACDCISSRTVIRALPSLPDSRGGTSHTIPIRACAAERGRDFEAPDLERANSRRGNKKLAHF